MYLTVADSALRLQLRILLRAIALLKPGGRLVYSTCSLNPTENEAVVSAALATCPGTTIQLLLRSNTDDSLEMSLVAVPEMLSNLVRRPGLTTWQVLDNNNLPATRPEDFVPSADKKNKKWTATLWPNGKEAERGLDRCLRIYPHLQDTGGFFVSVLVKAELVKKEYVKKEVAIKSFVVSTRFLFDY